jgi:hypothetical protein
LKRCRLEACQKDIRHCWGDGRSHGCPGSLLVEIVLHRKKVLAKHNPINLAIFSPIFSLIMWIASSRGMLIKSDALSKLTRVSLGLPLVFLMVFKK